MKTKETQSQPPQPGSLDEPSKTKVRIEIEYNMETAALVIRSHSPAVVLFSLLAQAKTVPWTPIPETALGAPRRVFIIHDLATELPPKVESDASALLTLGLLEMAGSFIGQNQVIQRIQGMAARAKLASVGGHGGQPRQ